MIYIVLRKNRHIKHEHFVSRNDIRAKILRIPLDLRSLPQDNVTIKLYFNRKTGEIFNIDKTRTYVGGMSKIFREYELVSADGDFSPQNSTWEEFEGGFKIRFETQHIN